MDHYLDDLSAGSSKGMKCKIMATSAYSNTSETRENFYGVKPTPSTKGCHFSHL